MNKDEIAQVQAHLRRLLGNQDLTLRVPNRKNASVELHVGQEFIGTVHRDTEEGETSYSVQIVVLEEDLTPVN